MLQTYSKERRQQNMTEIGAFRSQIVQETRAERMANLTAIQRARLQDKSWCAERSREIRDREKTALQRREQLKKNQLKELTKSARANLVVEHQKKVRRRGVGG
jgi:beta-xylosidase